MLDLIEMVEWLAGEMAEDCQDKLLEMLDLIEMAEWLNGQKIAEDDTQPLLY